MAVPPKAKQSVLISSLQLLACVAGIYGAYLTQGVVQETLATRHYGAVGARFTLLSILNAVQSWVCFFWAYLLMQLSALAGRGGSSSGKVPPFTAYWRPAISNCIGPACGFEALKYISYPAQVLVKSSKMITVMAAGTLVYGKRYSPLEYICGALISGGIALFGMKSSGHATQKLVNPNVTLGYTLCFVNLALDGFTNAAQDEITKQYSNNTPLMMMCWMNFWSGLFYLPYMFIATSIGHELVTFCVQYPEALYDIVLFCCCGAVGQLFIFYTIIQFGSLVNTLVTTSRKFLNILLSVVWNRNPLLPQQWAAVAMVFGGLVTSSLAKHRTKPKLHAKTH